MIDLKTIFDTLKIEKEIKENCNITSLDDLKEATESSISFIVKDAYIKDLENTKAKVVILKEEFLKFLPKGSIPIVCTDPYLEMAKISKLFAKNAFDENGDFRVGRDAVISKSATVCKNCDIADGVQIMASSVIGANVSIGKNSIIYPNVTIYDNVTIGKNCIIHSGSVIGSDGFGYAHTKTGEHVKIYHLGKTVLEDDVEIGANTTIDRAVIGTTYIRKGAKVDNLVQVGHNCDIGAHSLLVSQAGISGSTITGRNVVFGGQSGTAGHIQIGDFVQFAARTGVSKSLPSNGAYGGHPIMPLREWLKFNSKLKRLVK